MTVQRRSASPASPHAQSPRRRLHVRRDELTLTAIRSQGAGGQNVNKVATAIQLRFDIPASSLPETVKRRLLALGDRRISRDGVLMIKSQRYRTQDQNRTDALARLQSLLDKVAVPPKKRVATKPGIGAKRRRMEDKSRRSKLKAQRRGGED